MAERRMFAKTIIDSDAFLDMPLSSQTLYFHLSMRADDEGFINNPNKIQRVIGASNDDMKMLLAKNFIIHFDSGVIVIKHWKIHNYIRADRLVETTYKDERNMLEVKENGAYTISKDLKEIAELDELSSQDKRKLAYKNSTLPYSFDYKIKRAFENKICPVCGKIMNPAYKKSLPTIQHNIPLSKGGEHELNNISIICESCNTSIRDNETDSLNNEEVIRVWDNIVAAEKQNINWFWDVKLLETVGCQTNDGQMTDKCQNSIGKDSIDKDSLELISPKKETREIKPTETDIEVINYLNLVCEKRYRPSKSNIKYIHGRFNDGFTIEDLKRVIDIKASKWKNDPKMNDYLRPSTLFNSDNFEAYLNEKPREMPVDTLLTDNSDVESWVNKDGTE